VKTAHFDPTKGIVITSTTGETFVHVMLRKPGKALPPPRVEVKEDGAKSRTAAKLKCTCGECVTCKARIYSRRKRDPTFTPRKYNRKAKTRKQTTPKTRKQTAPKTRKQTAAKPATKITTLPQENVRIGIAGMFRAGMSISEIAGIFEVSSEFIEGLLREMF